MKLKLDFESHSPEQTEHFGEQFASKLTAGDVVAFYGDLGAGKTTMIKGIARAIGIDPNEVSSPSFALIHEYIGDKTIYHIDLYRVEKPEEIMQLGLWEIFDGDGISLVEWADRAPYILPENVISVEISSLDEDIRRIEIHRQ